MDPFEPVDIEPIDTGFVSTVTLIGARYATRALVEASMLQGFVAALGEGGPIPGRLDEVEAPISPFPAHVSITDMQITRGILGDSEGNDIEADVLRFTIRASSKGLTQDRYIREIGIFSTYAGAAFLFAYASLVGPDNNNRLREPLAAGVLDIVEFTVNVGITTQIAGALRMSFSSLSWVTEERIQFHERQNLVTRPDGVHGIRFTEDEILEVWDGEEWVVLVGRRPPIEMSPPITNFTAMPDDGKISLSWNNPIAPDNTFLFVLIRRGEGGFPEDVYDGIVVYNGGGQSFVDTDVVNGVEYFYRAFTWNSEFYNDEFVGQTVSEIPRVLSRFGVSIDLANSNPATAVTYIGDAAGLVPGGSGASPWDTKPIFRDIKPCVLKGGVVQYYLNPSNFAQKADGTASVITGADGDVMIEFPKVGFKIETSPDGNTLTVRVTDEPDQGAQGFRYYAHTREADGDRDKLYIGAYLGRVVSNVLRSISGGAPEMPGTQAIQRHGDFRAQAQANGPGYDILSFYPLLLLQCLFLIRFKSRNSQSALGMGFTTTTGVTSPYVQNVGATNANGMHYGSSSLTSRVKCFGLEDLWGNLFCHIDGITTNSNRDILTAFKGFNNLGAGYANRGQGAASNLLGWITRVQGDTERGFAIANQSGGSSTTHFADNGSLYGAGSSGIGAHFGGSFNDGGTGAAGIFALFMDNSSVNSGARLMYL